MTEQIVTYRVDESTIVSFEIEPLAGFRPAGAGEVLGWVRDAVAPAVDAARAVLDKVKESRPHHVEVKFGLKVSGTANWLIAKAATEGNFEITLSWDPNEHAPDSEPARGQAATNDDFEAARADKLSVMRADNEY